MNGANTVRVMLGAIWPSFLRLHNPLPASADIDTQTMICFFLFWLIQVPFLLLHPNQLRWLFMAKSIIVPIAWIAILGWALGSTDSNEIFKQKATIGGVAYSWAFLASMTSVIGNYATLSVNQSDFSRYSRISVKWQAIYVPFLPIIFTFIAFIGIAAASAGAAHYGTFLWDPMALVANWESRAARFFAAFKCGTGLSWSEHICKQFVSSERFDGTGAEIHQYQTWSTPHSSILLGSRALEDPCFSWQFSKLHVSIRHLPRTNSSDYAV